jgi:beta-xylosidase
MVKAIKIWNEPNNLSHWDFELDRDWLQFSEMVKMAAYVIRQNAPDIKIVLGGISPIDTHFMTLLKSYDTLKDMDAVAVHGFPLDWNHWKISEWPDKIKEIEDVARLPVWVTEVGVSSFGADEVQVFGIQKTMELLSDRLENVFWYSLLDLPPAWEATTRHKENEGSAYYRHFYMGLIRADGTPKASVDYYDPKMGMTQWIHFDDPRLDEILYWLRKLNVKNLRTGISWADWYRPNAKEWFDKQMEAIKDFDTTITLCFTPPSRGIRPHYTSPPVLLEEFAWFTEEVVKRYVVKNNNYVQLPQEQIKQAE